uniref:Uncharacterized protein n=1 Tax=Tetranychus urticae TaxID=32264 RepID=T1JV81_TETUR
MIFNMLRVSEITLFLWSFLYFNQCDGQPRITQSEANQVLNAFTNGGGLGVMRTVLDAVRRLESESTAKQSRLKNVFRRRLNYASYDLDSMDLEHEMIDETEQMMSTILYQLYDEWDTIIEPMREAFNLDDLARQNPKLFMYSPNSNSDPTASIQSNGPANETIMNIINGLSSVPKVFTTANNLLDRATHSLESGNLNYIDRNKLQDKVIEKLTKISNTYNFF